MQIEDNKKYEIKQAPATKKPQPTVSVPETVAETIDNKTSSQAHSFYIYLKFCKTFPSTFFAIACFSTSKVIFSAWLSVIM